LHFLEYELLTIFSKGDKLQATDNNDPIIPQALIGTLFIR